MSTYVKQTDLTVSITENISVNGQQYGNNQNYNFSGNGKVDQRVLEIPFGEDVNFTEVVSFSTTDGRGTFIISDYTYFRITNLDDTNFITLKLSRGADAQCYFVKVKPGESYVLMCPEIAAAVEEGASPALGNIGKISAKPDTASVYVEYLVVTKGGTATGEGGE